MGQRVCVLTVDYELEINPPKNLSKIYKHKVPNKYYNIH